MLLGIDFGTTRTVVAAVDRGNYPVISFEAKDGSTQEWYPSLIAANKSARRFGFEAVEKEDEPGWLLVRSFKRRLAALGPDSNVQLGPLSMNVVDVLSELLTQLRRDLYERSNLKIKTKEKLQSIISVPANANSNQRFITLEAFRRAGFDPQKMINEPSAAGIEYAHHHQGGKTAAGQEFVVVYDLGGGTFDASVIAMTDRHHEVLTSEGVSELGGDDFDAILLDMAMEKANLRDLTTQAKASLLEECREKKEGLHPNTRRIAIDLGRANERAGEVSLGTAEFYERCRPLIESTMKTMERAMETLSQERTPEWRSGAAIYLVGGSTNLPAVARMIRERYGRQVRKSAYPHAATAIGLAIAGDVVKGYTLRERFTRDFGVWREAENGRAVAVDVLFKKDTMLPERNQEQLTCTRVYRPAHNIGHFRFLECSRTNSDGQPTGDIMPWHEIYFPYDPTLQDEAHLEQIPVQRSGVGEHVIEEAYSCDKHGIINITITNHTGQFSRHYKLGARQASD